MFEVTHTVHYLDRAATVIGLSSLQSTTDIIKYTSPWIKLHLKKSSCFKAFRLKQRIKFYDPKRDAHRAHTTGLDSIP
jgi:hypothetical protein